MGFVWTKPVEILAWAPQKFEDVYLTSTKQDAFFNGCGQNDESATTFPMMINVGDTNSADVISLARSFSSAKTCMIFNTTIIR